MSHWTWPFRPDLLGAQLVHEALRVVDLRLGHGQDADLVGREPEGEVASVVLNEEADEALVRAQRREIGRASCRERVLAMV
jgi:hypothetical protein